MTHHTLQSKLEHSFIQFKDNIAFENESRSLSYSEVDRRANYITNWLINKGAQKGTFVGILLNERMEFIYSIIGIINAGCVFVPLDPAYPDKRIDVMIQTVDIHVVIIDKANYARFHDRNENETVFKENKFALIDELFSRGEHRWFNEKPPLEYSPEDKIYVYFTSGTTGTPKAILGKNGSLLHFLNWEIKTFGIDERFRFSQFTNPGFDVFLRDILVPLCAGARICIPDYRQVLLNNERLAPWISTRGITLIHCVPSLFRIFNALPSTDRETFKHLKYILLAGERVTPLDLQRWYEKNGDHTQLVNLYGPTETTLAKVFYLIRKSDAQKKNIPIGKPIDGARVIILDQDMDICDELVEGELYIRTPYRSFGYYNDPHLTKQKFIPNPFNTDSNDIIYKTGDLGRMLPDGNIELIGRADRQVKIRGRRIELEEIEAVLTCNSTVQEAAVIKEEITNQGVSLHAFVVPKGGRMQAEESFIHEIRAYLSAELPDYMVPSSIRILEQIPRKTNLKVAFDILGEMLKKQKEKEYIAPRNEIEHKLVEIWSGLLGVEKEKISITASFFELGGNSLNLMTLSSRIHRILNIKISLEQIFENSTIAKQAVLITTEANRDKFTCIEPVEKRDYYPLSSAQKRLYVLQQMDTESTRYNLSSVMVLEGELDIKRFEHAGRRLIGQHESLRTSFLLIHDEPVQKVHDHAEVALEHYAPELQTKEQENRAHTINRFIRPFDLSWAPLLRLGLINLGKARYMFMYDMHHIITDGISMGLLGNDFFTLYAGEELPPLKIRYRDYSQWQNREKQKETMLKQEKYWIEKFAGEIPLLNLPTDYVRPAILHFEGNTVNFEIHSQEIRELRQLALEENVTFYMTLLALYFILLSKLSTQEEITVGTPTAGRIHENLENVIGMFVNTLVLKGNPSGEKTIRQFLAEIKEKTVQSFENQEYQFEDLVNRLTLSRDVSRNPLFDVMFVYHNIDTMMGNIVEKEIAGLKPMPWKYQKTTSKFDLTLQITESNEKLNFSFEYSINLFKRETIERFIIYLKNIISGILKNRNQEIAELEILPEHEKQEILFDFNDTDANYPHKKTIHHLLAQEVEKAPDRIALEGSGRLPALQEERTEEFIQLTYRELNMKSSQLAYLLKEKGVKTDMPVGIMANRLIEVVYGMLAILQTGGAYLPIDEDYPQERIRYMLADSNVKVLLTSRNVSEKIAFENDMVYLEDSKGAPLFTQHPPAGLAYVIYTSGTTGRPKGSLISHKNVIRLLINDKSRFDFSQKDVWTIFHSFCFDFSVWEMYGGLLYGGKVIIIPKEIARDPLEYLKLLKKNKVTVLNQTPAAFYNLADAELNQPARSLALRYVIFGGEALNPTKLKKWQEKYPETKLINMFGITETTVHVTYKEITPRETAVNTSNIGKPIPTLSVYILDKYLRLLPKGTAGEICVGGAGIGRGYLNQVELTVEKFVTNPYLRGERIYRSGDLGRIIENNDLEYLGRIDRQVKIRGFRIELGEIERRLLSYKEIKEVLIMMKKNEGGDKYLCAYIIPHTYKSGNLAGSPETSKSLKLSELRSYLSQHLPDYMIPAYFVILDCFPLTPNGKIDRQALPEPYTGLSSDSTYIAPRNEIEKKLQESWQQVLGRNLIGIHDNFFELGGDSIKSIQIASRMNKEGYKFNLRDIFMKPQISELAPLVKKIDLTADQGMITGIVPLTPIQQWFFENSHVDNHHFNQATVLHFEEGIKGEAVKAIFSKLQEHHDALRTTVKILEGNIVQTVQGLEYPLSVKEYDLREQEDALEIMEQKANEIQASINLEEGPLMNGGLFQLREGTRLLIVIHHLVVDGVSWRILIEDIDTLYRQYKKSSRLVLPLKTDSYKKWAKRLYEYAVNGFSHAEKTYWEAIESTEIEPITKDYNEEHNYVKDAITLSSNLTPEQTRLLLTDVNHAYGTEINDILLAALAASIRKTWGHRKCLIALEGHGREDILNDMNLNRTVGWFTSIFPVILDMSYEDDLSLQIKTVKENLHQVPHKGIGHGILKYLVPGENGTRMKSRLNPQVSFNYLGQFNAELEQISFKTVAEGMGKRQSPERERKYEIEVFGTIIGKELNLGVTFNQRQYRKETIETLLSFFQMELNRLISFCTAKKNKEFTPSDYSYKKLSIETLDRLTAQYEQAIEDIYILTPMQEGMLFSTLYDKDSTVYFEQTSYRLHGRLDVEISRKSFNELVNRHDILRTAFIYEGKGIERPLQVVLKNRTVKLLYEDLRAMGVGMKDGRDRQENYIKEFKETDRKSSFDLSKDVLMRIAILQLGDTEYEFNWSHHHILMDGWCSRLLIAEFFEIYKSHLENRPFRLAPVQPYRTYIQWLDRQDRNESKAYWDKYLEDYDQWVKIPGKVLQKGEPQTDDKGYRNARLSILVEKEPTIRLNKLAASHNVTLNTVMQSAWGLLLGKYNNKEDVVFGGVVSGRPADIEGVEKMIGLFINTIPVRIRFNEKTTFTGLIERTQEKAVASEPFHYYPLSEIQASHPLKQNLINHVFIFENYPITDKINDMVSTEGRDNRGALWNVSNIERFEQGNYDFDIMVGPGEELNVIFFYNANAYEEDFVEGVGRHFKNILLQVLNNPEHKVDEISLLTEEEIKRLLLEFNNPAAAYPEDKTLQQLFEEQVERIPNHVAVAGPGMTTSLIKRDIQYISYEELNKNSNQLSRVLLANGLKTGGLVPLMVERSIQLIQSMLGILKAGGAYLTINNQYPGERITYMLADSQADLFVTQRIFLEKIPGICKIITLDDMNLNQHEKGNLPGGDRDAEEVAYVIFTSGSTGKPKGVLITHANVSPLLHWGYQNLALSPTDRVIQNLAISFDWSVWEIFITLTSGAALYIADTELMLDPANIMTYMARVGVTALHVTPTQFTYFLNEISTNNANILKMIRYLFIGAEKLNVELVKRAHELIRGDCRVFNMYGPTEAAIISNVLEIDGKNESQYRGLSSVPIGKPIANAQEVILDKHLHVCPVNIQGELHISGHGLARGYLNNPELTAEKFSSIPFKIPGYYKAYTSKRYYHTGDLCRWLPDGNIEFLGRIDHQVKIRGFRIETGEIENQLLTHPDIKEAVVLLSETIETESERQLYAYIVLKRELDISGLRQYLVEKLPLHMIPSYYVKVDNIPLTSNGKLDRKSLQEYGTSLGTGVQYVAPQNELETMIADAWKETLQLEKVGIYDNFFEIGGDSLKAVRLNNRLKERLNKEFSIVVLFEHVTIHSFIQYLHDRETAAVFSKEKIDRLEIMDKVKKTRVDRRERRRGSTHV